LKPPSYLSIETNNIWHKDKLYSGSADYDFVARKFISTFSGRVNFGLPMFAVAGMNPLLPGPPNLFGGAQPYKIVNRGAKPPGMPVGGP
jgi:hypothetical protein